MLLSATTLFLSSPFSIISQMNFLNILFNVFLLEHILLWCCLVPANTSLKPTTKALLRGGFIAIQAYLGKQEKYQVNNLTLHLKELSKLNPKCRR